MTITEATYLPSESLFRVVTLANNQLETHYIQASNIPAEVHAAIQTLSAALAAYLQEVSNAQ